MQTEKQKKKAEANRRYLARVKAGLVGKKKKFSIPIRHKNSWIKPKKEKVNSHQFKEVKSIKSIGNFNNKIRYRITLEDGRSSDIDVLMHEEEYVMQGDSRQRFSSAELKVIAEVLDKNNKGKETSGNLMMIEDEDDEDEDW